MKTNIFLFAMLLLLIVPQSGCKIRKQYKAEKQYSFQLQQQNDSIVHRFQQTSWELQSAKQLSIDQQTMIANLRSKKLEENISYESEQSLHPFEVKGQSFKTSFTANWALDSAAIKHGQLVYFDVDNPDFKAKIYKDTTTNQMMFEVQTKDKKYEIPVNRVKFQSSKNLQETDSSILASSCKSQQFDSSKTVYDSKDSGTASTSALTNIDAFGAEASSSTTTTKWFNGWQWLALGVGVVLVVSIFIKRKIRF